MLRRFFSENIVALSMYLLFLIIGLWAIFTYPKHELHLLINSKVGVPFIDSFFLYLTWFGDGILGIVLVCLAFLFNIRMGIYICLVFLFAALTTTLLKYQFFNDVHRPHYIFQWIDIHDINKVEGAALMIHRSFPSGHATQSFALFFSLALAVRGNSLKGVFVFWAILTAFSRVYLSQHWTQDILAGSLVGVFFSVLFYLLFYQKNTLIRFNKSLVSFKKN